MSLFIDSGAVLYYLYGRFSRSIEQQKQIIVAKSTVWVWCGVAIMYGQIIYMFTDAC